MNINIIGGSGFIGTKLIERLLPENTVRNFDKNNSAQYSDLTQLADVREPLQLSSGISSADALILLAAEHKDNVSPISLYYDVNVQGTRNVVELVKEKDIKKIIFTSSVAVYGLNNDNPNEESPINPFNHYGLSKYDAEKVLVEWYKENPEERTLIILRPSVVFGPENRGNVYNLLAQISSGKFLMIGKGNNLKSMAYVENIVAFIKFLLDKDLRGYHVFNYADKPDLSMNELIEQTEKLLAKRVSRIKIPYAVGYLGGLSLDVVGKLLGRTFPISAVRVKKFCATTQFSSEKLTKVGFERPYTLKEGLEKTIQSILAKKV